MANIGIVLECETPEAAEAFLDEGRFRVFHQGNDHPNYLVADVNPWHIYETIDRIGGVATRAGIENELHPLKRADGYPINLGAITIDSYWYLEERSEAQGLEEALIKFGEQEGEGDLLIRDVEDEVTGFRPPELRELLTRIESPDTQVDLSLSEKQLWALKNYLARNSDTPRLTQKAIRLNTAGIAAVRATHGPSTAKRELRR